jgi:hypothetical protein
MEKYSQKQVILRINNKEIMMGFGIILKKKRTPHINE